MLTASLTMWNKPNERVKCNRFINERVQSNRFIIEEGAKINIDGEDCQMLKVVANGKIYNPVVNIEVL